jgi:hypothetical protein
MKDKIYYTEEEKNRQKYVPSIGTDKKKIFVRLKGHRRACGSGSSGSKNVS